jgi:hypothetical protein
LDDCANEGTLVIPATDARARVRTALNGFGLNGSAIADNVMQTATSNLCDGEVVAEFAINAFPATALIPGTPKSLTLSLVAHPRLTGQRCNGAAAKLCYQTNRGNAVHGTFGDTDGDVCVTDFVLTGVPAVDFPPSSPTLVNDATLPPVAGDLIDTSFKISTNVPNNCPAGEPQMCVDNRRRICFKTLSECAE